MIVKLMDEHHLEFLCLKGGGRGAFESTFVKISNWWKSHAAAHIFFSFLDRYFWDTWDPINLAEGLFAIANILSFFRISYLLPANQNLGPLQICIGRMLKVNNHDVRNMSFADQV